jgi:DNA-binding IclR family transcriptional regulator
MVQRKTVPIDGHSEIALTVENMSDGTWAVAVAIRRVEGATEAVMDLPMPTERFPSQEDAEAFGLRMAREWIAANMPRAA